MFDKRLLSLVPGIMPLIVGSVAAKWIALLCNIAIIATIGNVFAALLAGMPASGVGAGAAVAGAAAFDARTLLTLAMLIIVRAISIYAAQRAGDKAAFAAKRQVRQLVYDKLVQMGPAYTEQVSTAEAVQTSVEGAQQLEVYFGGYLPQLFYAVLATSRASSGLPTLGVNNTQMQAIAAAVIGGASLSGGRGSIAGTMLGVLFITILYNGANLVGVSPYVQDLMIGSVIIISAGIDLYRRNKHG